MSDEPDHSAVTLVIPGRNCSTTIGPCLDAVTPLLNREELDEIIFVDDGSTDGTAEIVAQYPVRCVPGPCRGPGGARNVGWRLAETPLVWVIDSDCVAADDALARLLPYLENTEVVGVGGSYGNMCPDSLIACLIHEEIRVRHHWMPSDVNFLATFNVVYRRGALEAIDGFAEEYIAAQDAELAFRLHEAGGRLCFDAESIVSHFHETTLRDYMRRQYRKAYYRVPLYLSHARFARGDSYSGPMDHLQPPLAMLSLASLPLLVWLSLAWIPVALILLLLLSQLPMTRRLLAATRQPRYAMFVPFGFLRSYVRGLGLTIAVIAYSTVRRRNQDPRSPSADVPSSVSYKRANGSHESARSGE